MRTPTCAVVFGLLCLSAAGLPDDIPVDPLKMKAGESACVFPLHHTAEGNIWIARSSVYRRNDRKCIFSLKREGLCWIVYTSKIPIYMDSHDAELKRLGFLWLGHSSIVLR